VFVQPLCSRGENHGPEGGVLLHTTAMAVRRSPHLPRRLAVPGCRIGTGGTSGAETLGKAGRVRFVGQVNDAELAWLYANSAGVIAAGQEDFGLAPVEGACFGKSVAALRSGGFLDTVVEGTTGVFFDVATPQRIASAVQHLLQHPWDADKIAEHSQQFAQSCFARRVGDAIRTPSPAATTAGA
jgi:glycosyltransferase involved in cell wall biosynthesis